MIKAIIFDFFGVLYTDTFFEVYKKFGGDINKEKEFIKKTFHESHTGKSEKSSYVFSKRFNVSIEEWENELWKNRKLNYELLTYIKKVKQNYKTAILSNIGQRGIKPYISDEILSEYFDEVVISSQIGYDKPQKEAFEITARKLNVNTNECIFIDDRQEYIIGAQAVGMKTILFETTDKCIQEIEELLNSTQNV